MKPDKPKAAARAIGAATAVLAAGFGALIAFSLGQPAAASLPGLFDFASATWGDGLVLPLMIGSLTYVVSILPAARREALVASSAGLPAAALGAAVQVTWLRADASRLNWTLPRPHHFTAAGWYHATFLVVICGLAAALWAVALHRTVHTEQLPRRVIVALVLGLAAGIAFIALLVVDAGTAVATDTGNTSLLSALAGLIAVLTAAGSVIARRRLRT